MISNTSLYRVMIPRSTLSLMDVDSTELIYNFKVQFPHVEYRLDFSFYAALNWQTIVRFLVWMIQRNSCASLGTRRKVHISPSTQSHFNFPRWRRRFFLWIVKRLFWLDIVIFRRIQNLCPRRRNVQQQSSCVPKNARSRTIEIPVEKKCFE